MTLRRTARKPKQRWGLLAVIVVLATMIVASASQATVSTTLFELDKDAFNDTTSARIGALNAAVAASPNPTSIQICQVDSTNHNGATILVDAERMTLSNRATASGGGCANKFNYTAARGANSTSPGAHAKAEDVTLLTFPTKDGDDWDQVYDLTGNDPANKCTAIGAVECAWTHDGRAMSIFTQSKDYDEISDDNGATAFWQWRNQSVPDADELDDGFAVKYVDGTTGDQHLYFGADRFAVNGSKDAGFWFFHDDVVANDLPPGGGDGTFEGLHTAPHPGQNGVFCGSSPTPNCSPYDADDSAGDILILTTFTGGGAVTTVRVFEWVGPAGSDAALLFRGGSGDCAAGSPGSVCATVNNTTIESPWPYDGKNEPADDEIASGGFLEGGINLSDLGLDGCFSSFMATTRSSPSVTADPKDFILGDFEACDTELTTTPKDGAGNNLAADTDDDNLVEISIGDGSVEVTDSAVLNVKGTTSFSGNLSFYLCGPIENPTACSASGVNIGAAGGVNPVTSNGTYSSAVATVTEVGRYCWFGFFDSNTDGVPDDGDDAIESDDPASTGECFEVLPVTPELTTTATATVKVGDPISDTATLAGTTKQPGTNGGTTPGVAGSVFPSINATNGADAGGTITFNLYDTADCTGTPIYTATRAVSGNGTYPKTGQDLVSFTPSSAGIYKWVASYDGSSPNTLGDSGACDDANETSVVVDARISIAESATNEVGHEHTFTVHVEENDGTGWADAEGEIVTITWPVATPGTIDDDDCDTTGTDANGECTVTINSDVAGTFQAHAASDVVVSGLTLTRETDGLAGNSGDATKVFVDAYITIAPDEATNEVDDEHTFNVEVFQDDGRPAADPDGDGVDGWAPAPDHTFVTVTLTDANGADSTLVSDTCADDGSDPAETGTIDGKCSVTITSSSAGQVTAHASVTFDVGGVSLTRETDGAAPNSGDAVKFFVDAYITINPPTAENIVGDPHTFEVLVQQDDGRDADQDGDGTPGNSPEDGDGVTGWADAPNGTIVDVSLTDTEGADSIVSEDTCADDDIEPPTDGTISGECGVTFTSATAGHVSGHAAVTFVVGGVELFRETDAQAPNSGDAEKDFIAGSIAWAKEYADELQGGATFEVCLTHDYDLEAAEGEDPFVELAEPDCTTVVDDIGEAGYAGNDEDDRPGLFLLSGQPLGRYSITETAAPDGFEIDPTPKTVELVPGLTDVSIVDDPFINSRPVLKITGFGYTNVPDGDQPHGILKGTTTYTVTLHNYGTADAHLTNSSLVVSDNSTCAGGNTLDLSGATIAAGADGGPYTLVCTYDSPDPAEIDAVLNVKYTTNNLERTASGSPATITYTVAAD